MLRAESQGGLSSGLPEVIVVGKVAFPHGRATSFRVRMLALALVEQGIPTTVLVMVPTESKDCPLNTAVNGEYHGVRFEYTCGATVRSLNPFARRLRSLLGLLVVLKRVAQTRSRSRYTVLYTCGMQAWIYSLLVFYARLLGVRTVVDLQEWWPALPSKSRFQSWFFKNLRFRFPDAVFSISKFLTEKVHDMGQLRVLEIPILCDASEISERVELEPVCGQPYVLWCGSIRGYLDDVLWLVQVMGELNRANIGCRLVLVGQYSEHLRTTIEQTAHGLELPSDRIVLTGYVNRSRLLSLYMGAEALLIPLRDDDRSRARFPTKIGEYLCAGRPIITSSVGEIPRYFADGENALVCPPEDIQAFARAIKYVLTNPDLARQIGEEGRKTAKSSFHYALHGPRIARFLRSLFDELKME